MAKKLSFDEQTKILNEVILGVKAPKGESSEAAAHRKSCEADVARAKKNGQMIEPINDWDSNK